MTGAGLRAAVLPRPLPTPVLAFAIRHLGAVAGVEVTASHNPPRDNGYKVYLGDGSQIVPPADAGIAAEIHAIAALADVPRPDGGWLTLDDSVLEAYLARTDAVLSPGSPRTARTVYTAMHGVGKDVLLAAFARAGFPAPVLVAEQAEPDPLFPTVAFPNPEEPGAMDLAFARARETDPDLVIANDPDADRCAVAVKDGGAWRMLRGDEVGALLGAHLVARGARGTFAESIVSSSLLGRIAEKAGLPYEETLTGFKWIARVDGLRYGYEEALGYCVDPEGVRDKDGITAALLVTELASVLKAGAAPSWTCWTTSPWSTGCTPPTSCRCGCRTCRSSPTPCAGCASTRRRSWRACPSPARRTSSGARRPCRRPTACATRSTAPGWWSDPAAPSRS